MAYRRTHDTLSSLLHSFMLTSIVFAAPSGTVVTASVGAPPSAMKIFLGAASGLRAQGLSLPAELPAPAVSAAPAATPAAPAATPTAPAPDKTLQPADLPQIVAIARRIDTISPFNDRFATALGLPAGLSAYYLANRNDPTQHFMVGTTDPSVIVFGKTIDGDWYLYRTDSRLRLISACIGKKDGNSAAPRPAADAMRDFPAILRYWGSFFH